MIARSYISGAREHQQGRGHHPIDDAQRVSVGAPRQALGGHRDERRADRPADDQEEEDVGNGEGQHVQVHVTASPESMGDDDLLQVTGSLGDGEGNQQERARGSDPAALLGARLIHG
jgi:hypothetical protein